MASITLFSQNQAFGVKGTLPLDNIRSTKLSRMQSVQKSKKLIHSKMIKTKRSKRKKLLLAETSLNLNLINSAVAVLLSQGLG